MERERMVKNEGGRIKFKTLIIPGDNSFFGLWLAQAMPIEKTWVRRSCPGGYDSPEQFTREHISLGPTRGCCRQ